MALSAVAGALLGGVLVDRFAPHVPLAAMGAALTLSAALLVHGAPLTAYAAFVVLGLATGLYSTVLSDNGSCYRSGVHAEACRELGMRHLFTRPYRPRTNGKAERFIQTLTNRWAYGTVYGSSAERTAALPGWLTHYNFTRRHGSLGSTRRVGTTS